MRLPDVSRRSSFLLTFIGLLSASSVTATQSSDGAFTGKWEADDGSVILEMYSTGTELQAHLLYGNKVVETDHVTFKKDTSNPNPSLRASIAAKRPAGDV